MFSTTDRINYFFFLAFGLTRVRRHKALTFPLVEPDGVRICRRNIIAVGGLLVLAGLASADPGDLNVFGVKPGNGNRGVFVISAAVIAAQLYWYYLKYCHLKEDGKIYVTTKDQGEQFMPINIVRFDSMRQKNSDFFSDWVAFSVTIVSWCFMFYWIDGCVIRLISPE